MSGKGGKKIALTKDQVQHYEDELNGQYILGEQVGRSGAMTCAYLLTDKTGKQFVLKIPKKIDELDVWHSAQKKSIDLRNAYVGDYQGRINVPKTIKIGLDYVVEELAEGEEFFASVYQKLSPIEKKKVAQDLGEFINYSHQRTLTDKTAKLYPNQQKRVSWQDTYNYFAPVLTEDEKKELRKEIQIHEEQKESPVVLAFRDYRYSNMLWDSKSKCLSVIDFDCTKNSSVYEEFTPAAAASAVISYQFWADVINAYNHSPKKYPISIDLETVRHNFFVGIYHEYARCNIGKKSPQEVLPELRSDLKELSKLVPTDLAEKKVAKGNLFSMIKKGKQNDS